MIEIRLFCPALDLFELEYLIERLHIRLFAGRAAEKGWSMLSDLNHGDVSFGLADVFPR